MKRKYRLQYYAFKAEIYKLKLHIKHRNKYIA